MEVVVAEMLRWKSTRHLPVVETIVTVQRDYGDRQNRKHARMKYLVEDRGMAGSVPNLSKIRATACNILHALTLV